MNHINRKLKGYDVFKEVFGNPKYILAPMIDASELSFRMLTRKYGVHLAYTPMIHSKQFHLSKKHREKSFSTCPEDRPLIAQFSGNDPDDILKASRYIQDQCDAIDVNFGCPQSCARKGKYGSFLLDHPDVIKSIVQHLNKTLDIPLTCKMRILPSLDDTLRMATLMEENGCQMLAVHGRTRDQKGNPPPMADWNVIREIKKRISIPLVANGNIDSIDDANRCMEFTGADAVMSGFGLLENPLLFSGTSIKGNIQLKLSIAKEYLEFAKKYDANKKNLDIHIFHLINECFMQDSQLRSKFVNRKSIDEAFEVIYEFEKMKW